jgi:thioester reductase-like protein
MTARYFLTGGTGTVGSCILEHLLAQGDSEVHLLARADSDESAEKRKLELLEAIMGTTGTKHAARVRVIRGDTKLPSFGMPDVQYRRLLRDCTHIIHSAGLVRMNLPLEEARDSAVRAAENVISLAHALQQSGQLQKVEFVSTVGVGGHQREVVEDWIETPRNFHNTYEQAKAEAEIKVRAAVRQGLPITVHRPSMVVGDSITGRTSSFQIFYHLCEFLTGSRSRGLFPSFGRTRLDTIPVDYVARAIIWSSGSQQTSGRILHLCSGPRHAIALGDLQRLVVATFRARGIPVPRTTIIPRALFRAMLVPLGMFAPEKIRRAIKTAPIFLDYLASEQVFQNEATEALLGAQGIPLPPPQAYLDKVLNYYLDRRARH